MPMRGLVLSAAAAQPRRLVPAPAPAQPAHRPRRHPRRLPARAGHRRRRRVPPPSGRPGRTPALFRRPHAQRPLRLRRRSPRAPAPAAAFRPDFPGSRRRRGVDLPVGGRLSGRLLRRPARRPPVMACIVLYNIGLKRVAVAGPVLMGACRAGNLLLGTAAASAGESTTPAPAVARRADRPVCRTRHPLARHETAPDARFTPSGHRPPPAPAHSPASPGLHLGHPSVSSQSARS
jgi:hypothetical protein